MTKIYYRCPKCGKLFAWVCMPCTAFLSREQVMERLTDLFLTWCIVGIAAGLAWLLSIEVSWRLLLVIGVVGILADRKQYYRRS